MRPVALCALVLATACGAQQRANREGRFDLGEPGTGWRKVSAGGADQAWSHAGMSATIYADSNCGERYDDSELAALAQHLTFGVARGEPLRTEPLQLDGRDALVVVVRGQLDGVGVQVGAMVTKKNACLYDVLYLAPPSRFDQGWPDFMRVVQGFETKRSDR